MYLHVGIFLGFEIGAFEVSCGVSDLFSCGVSFGEISSLGFWVVCVLFFAGLLSSVLVVLLPCKEFSLTISTTDFLFSDGVAGFFGCVSSFGAIFSLCVTIVDVLSFAVLLYY